MIKDTRIKKNILWFSEIGNKDVKLVGGKNASLGEMYSNLTKKGINIPNGFAVTAGAYRYILKVAKADKQVKEILKGVNTNDIKDLAKRAKAVRELILSIEFPEDLQKEISAAYRKLSRFYKTKNLDVAVRSSATAEDLPSASFAGQQESYLNISGEKQLLETVRKCMASLFTDRAISYREDKGFDHFKIALSVTVQKMVRSDIASAGVMFSIDTETGFPGVVVINAAWGLGEMVVKGSITPDEYFVFKETLGIKGFSGKPCKPIIGKEVGSKEKKMVYNDHGTKTTKILVATLDEKKSYVLKDKEILQLARWAKMIETYYDRPMDMEWAKDGEDGKLYIVQARPETVESQEDRNVLIEYSLQRRSKILLTGAAVGSKIGQGLVQIVKDVKSIDKFISGQVLVTEMTDPDWEPIMKRAAAIVTNSGGRTCFDGDTRILTNKGFMFLQDVYKQGHQGLLILSFNKISKKIEWKPIVDSMKKKSKCITVSISQTGRIKDNILKLTPDHKMVNIREGKIVDTEIAEILERKEMLCVAQRVPALHKIKKRDKKLAYLLGGIMTDGNIYRTKTHGEVQFIQKNVPVKRQFIKYMQDCMIEVYHKSFVPFEKKVSNGFIRGKKVRGQAVAYRLYSKDIAYKMYEEQEKIVTTLLQNDNEFSHNFLAGVIDGDGSFYNNRVQIYISDNNLLQAVIVACLKLGIAPQVTKNRHINNVQIVEKLDEILSYTKRVKGKLRSRIIMTRFFSAKQVLGDIRKYGDRKTRNLYVSEQYLNKLNNTKINKLLAGDLRMQRVIDQRRSSVGNVYNITVQGNHTYVVFTDKLTPVIVNNCHAAIVSRELGIPCIVGTGNATEILKNKQKVTVSCAEGEKGLIYQGLLKFKVKKTNLKKVGKPKIKIMMNVGEPRAAFLDSFIPNDGVGLAREEFIINNYIKVHPLALINFKDLTSKSVKKQIEALTFNYKTKSQFFVDKLAEGVGRIAAAFYPKDVIVRLSDFKSNEYANLIGGKQFEPKEDNPMIGWRGASRYYDPKYLPAFKLECAALKKVRENFGLTNVKIMIPFCRTIKEAKQVLAIMEGEGLKQGNDDLEVYVMCEIPSNVVLAKEFAKLFDGFSIGSNDLTQLILGVDRDSEIVSHIYDERNLAVKRMLEQVITTAHKYGCKVGICGQAPSDFPAFAQMLVKLGIDSISLIPDTVIKTTLKVLETEKLASPALPRGRLKTSRSGKLKKK